MLSVSYTARNCSFMFLFGLFEDKGLLEPRQLRIAIKWKDPEKTPENDKILKTI